MTTNENSPMPASTDESPSLDRRTDRLERVLAVLVDAKKGDRDDEYDSVLGALGALRTFAEDADFDLEPLADELIYPHPSRPVPRKSLLLQGFPLAQEIVQRFILAQGAHLSESWRDALAEAVDLEQDPGNPYPWALVPKKPSPR